MNPIADQYRIIREAAGWIDRRGRGLLRVEGRDAIPFLQALVTNDVGRLARGEGIYATHLTAQGRMIADLEIYHRGEALIAAVASGVAAPLAARLDDAIFAEDVRVSDATAALADLLIVGGGAAALVSRALGIDLVALNALPELAQLDVADGFVARSGEAPIDAFRIVAPAEPGHQIARRIEAHGALPMKDEFVEALRVAAGRPAFGIDMTDQTIPLEAGLLDRGISTTKGCYVGQEIIIRVLHRGAGRMAKRLVTLAWDPPPAAPRPAASTPLVHEGRAIGHLTSIAPALTGEGVIGLGYVARDMATIGQQVTIGDRDGLVAEITGFAR